MRFLDALKAPPQQPYDGDEFLARLDQTLAAAGEDVAGIEAQRLGARAAIRQQVQAAAPPRPKVRVAYNPRTREFLVGGQLVPADVRAIKEIAALNELPEMDITPDQLPEGFVSSSLDAIKERNAFLDENKESDFFSLGRVIGMGEALTGAATTGVGNLLGQDFSEYDPLQGATESYLDSNQNVFEKYGRLERPTESLVGAINAAGQAVETGIPVIAAGLGTAAVTLNPAAGLGAAIAVGGTMAADDAGGETRDRLTEYVQGAADAELLAGNETYATLRMSLPEAEAKAELVRRGVLASSWTAAGISTISSIGGMGLARLLPKGGTTAVTDALLRGLRGRDASGVVASGLFPAARATAGLAGLASVGEGTQEFLERDLSQNVGDIAAGLQNAALGKYGTRDDFFAGMIGGAVLSGPGAYTSSAALRARDPRRPGELPQDIMTPEQLMAPQAPAASDVGAALQAAPGAPAAPPPGTQGTLDVDIEQPAQFVPNQTGQLGALAARQAAGQRPTPDMLRALMAQQGVPAQEPAADPNEATPEDLEFMIRSLEFDIQRMQAEMPNVRPSVQAEIQNEIEYRQTKLGELTAALERARGPAPEGGLFTPDGAPNPQEVQRVQEEVGQQMFDADLEARGQRARGTRLTPAPPSDAPAGLLPSPAPVGDDGSVRVAAEQELATIRPLLEGTPSPELAQALQARVTELERALTELPLRGGAMNPPQEILGPVSGRPTASQLAARRPAPGPEPTPVAMDPGPSLITPKGSIAKAARAAAGNLTLAEAQSDIDAQMAEMMDPNAARDAVWVSKNPDGTPAPQPSKVPAGVERVDTPAGTLYTINQSKADGLRKNPAQANNASFVSDLLGFNIEAKKEVLRAAAKGEPVTAVVAKDAKGNTTATSLVTKKNLKKQVDATAAATGKTPAVENPVKTVADRVAKAQAETPAPPPAPKGQALKKPAAPQQEAPKAAPLKKSAAPAPKGQALKKPAQQPGPVKPMTPRQYLEKKVEESTDVDELARLQEQLDNLPPDDAGRRPGKGSPRLAEENPKGRKEVDKQVEADVNEALADERDGDVEVGLLDEPPTSPKRPTEPVEVELTGGATIQITQSRPNSGLELLRWFLNGKTPSSRVGRVRALSTDEQGFFKEAAAMVNVWMDEFMPKSRQGTLPVEALLFNIDDLPKGDLRNMFGGDAAQINYLRTTDGRAIAVIGVSLKEVKASAKLMRVNFESMFAEILAHEFGHVIERQTFHALSLKDQEAVIAAYERWLANFPKSPRGAGAAWADRSGPMAKRNPNAGNPANTRDTLEYARNYKEWAADNIGRALLRMRAPRNAIERFFDSVAGKIKSMWMTMTQQKGFRKEWTALVDKDNPDATILRVLNEQAARVAQANAEGRSLNDDWTNADTYESYINSLLNDVENDPVVEDYRRAQNDVDAAVFDAEAELDRAREAQNRDYNAITGIAEALRGDGTIRDRVRGAKGALMQSKMGDRLRQLQAALMTQDQMVQKFENMGAGARQFASFLRRNVAANKAVERIASEAREKFELAFEAIANLDGRYRDWLQVIMHDATFLDMHPDVEFTDKANAHLITPENPGREKLKREQHARLRAKYLLLAERAPKAAELYITLREEARELNAKIARTQVRDLYKEIERILDMKGADMMAKRKLVAELRAGTISEESQAFLDSKAISKSQRARIAATRAQISQIRTQRLERQRGPWFPLRRRGDYIVKVPMPDLIVRDVDEDGNEMPFATREQAENARKRAAANNPATTPRVNVLKDDDGKVYGYDVRIARKGVFFFESEGAANAAIEDMKETVKRLWSDEDLSDQAIEQLMESIPEEDWKPKRVSEMYSSDKVVPQAILDQLKALGEEGMPEHLFKHFQRLALEADAHYTLNASALPRRNIIGASHDMLTGLGEWVYGASYNLGMLDQANEIATTWAEMKKLAKTDVEQQIFLDALNKNNELTRERRELTTANTISNVMTRVSSLFSLAFSPAYVMLNATQPHIVATPLLAAKMGVNGKQLGMVEASKYILDAMRGNPESKNSGFGLAFKNGGREFMQQFRSLVNAESGESTTPEMMFQQVLDTYARNPTERALLTSLRNQGVLDFGHLAAMQDVMATSTLETKFQNIQRMGMAFAQHVETMNRTITALGAYRAATEKLGYDPVIDLDGEALALSPSENVLSFVQDFLSESMINYSMANRPNVFKYQWMGPLLQFKMYTQGIYSMFLRHTAMLVSSDPTKRKVGRDTLLGLLGTHAAFGGFLGLGPIAAGAQVAVWAVVAAFGDEEDDQWKDRATLTDALFREYFGEGALGTALQRGLPAALLNADMSSRIGIPNLIDTRFMGIRESATGRDNFDAAFLSTLGPVYSNIRRGLVGSFSTVGEFSDWAQGKSTSDDVLRELSSASPAGFRAMVDAARYMTTGLTERDGDTILSAEELGSYNSFVRALGVTPTSVSKTFDARSREFDTLTRIEKERTDILRYYAGAETQAQRLRARERIREFNRTVPKELQIQPSSAERARGSRAERDAGKVDARRESVREMLEG